MIKLIEALSDTNRDLREEAVNALVKLGPAAIDPLVAALKSNDGIVRQEAAGALGRIRDPRVVDPLIAALKDEDSIVSYRAADALGDIKDPRAVESPHCCPEG